MLLSYHAPPVSIVVKLRSRLKTVMISRNIQPWRSTRQSIWATQNQM